MMIIKVRESEFRRLLHREKVVADVERAYSMQLEMLRDVINYGTNLIPRSFGLSGKELKDIVVVTILLRQVVSMLDGVELLASGGAVYAAALQGRALLEASGYIDWILQGDAERKAAYYYVHNLRRHRRWAQRLQPRSPEAKSFFELVPDDLPSLNDPGVIERAGKAVQEIDRVLLQPRFAAVAEAFDQCARRRGKHVPWYAPLGVPNLAALFKTIGRSAEYVVFHAIWSEAVHSSNYAQHVLLEKGKVTIEPIRHLSEFDSVFRFSVATAFHSYRKILEVYRPGELRVFSRKYLENWQEAFMQVPRIKYEVLIDS